jgi:hypothetical protein
MPIIYKQCPKCGSKNSIKIRYGLPTPKLFLEAEVGKVKLGGCCIMESSPEYFCKDCEYEWDRKQAIDAAYRRISIIRASVGGFFEGYYDVTIDFNKSEFTWNHPCGSGKTGTINKTIRKATGSKFLEELKLTNLLNWKAEYWDNNILDGTQWSVEIVTDGRVISKSGSNDYPEGWEMFCKLIRDTFRVKFE